MICNAQNTVHTYRNFDDRDGIRTSTMFGMAQDKQGFIWIGTDNGLHRYDGHRFEVIQSPLDNTQNTIGNQLREVLYDSIHNRLWLLSLSDFQYLDLNDYSFHRWFDLKKTDISILSYQKYMAQLSKEELLFSTEGNIYKYDIKGKSIKKIDSEFPIPNHIKRNYAIIEKYRDHSVAIIFPNYILIKNLSSGKVDQIYAKPDEVFTDVEMDLERPVIYIAAKSGLVTYHLDTQRRITQTFPYDVKSKKFLHNIHRLVNFDETNLMLTGMGGFILFDKSNQTYQHYQTGNGDFEDRVNAYNFLNDREGNLWKSSHINYCNVLYRQNRKMIKTDIIKNIQGVNIEPYRNIRLNDSLFAFCGSAMTGIGLLHYKNGKYSVIENAKNTVPIVSDVIKTKEGNALTLTQDNIFLFETNTHKFTPLLFEVNGIKQSIINTKYIKRYNEHSFIAVSRDFIYVLDLTLMKAEKTEITTFLKKNNDLTPYALEPLLVVDNTLYLGKDKLLYEFDLKSKILKLAWENDQSIDKEFLHFVQDMELDGQNQIWIGTMYNGVLIFNLITKKWNFINKNNSGLINNNIIEMTLDPHYRMWVMDVDKKYIFNTKSHTLITIKDKNEGFPNLAYSVNMEKNDHVMTFNNYPIIQILDLKKNPLNTYTHPTTITSILTNDVEKLKIPISKDTLFNFSHLENNLSFSFTNLCFNNSQNNQYKYKLEGLDTSWTISNNPWVEYKRLPSGTYTFMLQASNNEGIWDSHIQKVVFKINPVFYKSWWFVLISSMMIGWLIYFYYKQKTNRIRSEANIKGEYQKKIAEIEMKALRAQMNPHFIFNSLNSIQKFIFERDEYTASQYLTKFSRLIRLILDTSNQDFVTLGNEMEMLRYYVDMEKLRFSDKFSLQLLKHDDVQDTWLIPSMVIQPHVENAIWHGLMHKEGDCKLLIEFVSLNNHSIKVIIEDNGVGRSNAETLKSKQSLKKKSYGSHISQDRVKYFAELTGRDAKIDIVDLKDKHGEPLGTRIELILPIQNL